MPPFNEAASVYQPQPPAPNEAYGALIHTVHDEKFYRTWYPRLSIISMP